MVARRPGFSFVEVLFAVMILGIGFVMIAAIFPVALSQTKLTTEETSAGVQVFGAVDYIQQFATDANLPPTAPAGVADGELHPLPDAILQMMGGNLISTSNPRAAVIPFYRRSPGWPNVQLVLIPMRVRNRDTFRPGEDMVGGVGLGNTFTPRHLNVTGCFVSPDFTDQNVTLGPAGDDPTALDAVAEGCYIVIEKHPAIPAKFIPANYVAGHVYRLGSPVTAGDQTKWTLIPGWDVRKEAGVNGKLDEPTSNDDVTSIPFGSGVTAWLIGRGRNDQAQPGVEGPTQDVAAFTTFINLR